MVEVETIDRASDVVTLEHTVVVKGSEINREIPSREWHSDENILHFRIQLLESL